MQDKAVFSAEELQGLGDIEESTDDLMAQLQALNT